VHPLQLQWKGRLSNLQSFGISSTLGHWNKSQVCGVRIIWRLIIHYHDNGDKAASVVRKRHLNRSLSVAKDGYRRPHCRLHRLRNCPTLDSIETPGKLDPCLTLRFLPSVLLAVRKSVLEIVASCENRRSGMSRKVS
jgi:hypothetical protein